MARKYIENTYDSILDFANAGYGHVASGEWYSSISKGFSGVATLDEAKTLADKGWTKELPYAEDAARDAIDAVKRETDMPVFDSFLDFTGSSVDMGQYLAGEPECMWNFDMPEVPKEGRVITLCASVCYSAALSVEAIKRRGHGLVAFALALTELNLNVELWADMTVTGRNYVYSNRVLIKGANDVIDPARIMYAYAHPSMLRVLGFGAWHERENVVADVGRGYGSVTAPTKNLPEGTIYLPGVLSDRDVPDADVLLRRLLADLGLVD